MRTQVMLALVLFCSSYFLSGSTSGNADKQTDVLDSSFVVSVKFNDIPNLPPYCGISIFKSDYKFELHSLSRYAVISKEGKIRIRFTCPRETATGFLVPNQIFRLRIKVIDLKKLTKREWDEIMLHDDIPVYEYAGRY
jgi:hypothetical protein